jgi:hypothetical protein
MGGQDDPFDFSYLQNQGSDFGFGPPPAPPQPSAPVMQTPVPVQQYAPPVQMPPIAPVPRPTARPAVQVDQYGQPVIRQPAPAPIGDVPTETNQEPGARPVCPNDGTQMHKAGFRWSGRTHKLQAWQCPSCGYTTTKRLPTMDSPYGEAAPMPGQEMVY